MSDLISELSGHPAHVSATRQGVVSFRASATPFDLSATTHVLLHGIGSGSGSWIKQLKSASSNKKIIAWDAPGYGQSSHLKTNSPTAIDYADRLWSWLDSLHLQQPVTLVGHSLGAIIATKAALLKPAQVSQLILLSPALGYGACTVQDKSAVQHQRLSTLRELGPQGMAQKRSAALLSNHAPSYLQAYVAHIMSQITVAGYEQAVHLLVNSDLLADIKQLVQPPLPLKVTVACGDLDTITPPSKCQHAANAAHTHLLSLGASGHACALEAFDAVDALLNAPDHEPNTCHG